MATTEALVTGLSEQGKPIFVRKQVPLPVPGEHQARVRVSHVAQNPTDGMGARFLTLFLTL